MPDRVDYDLIAPTYDRRYEANRLEGVAGALRGLVGDLNAQRILEAGCGTGRWLRELSPAVRQAVGLDLSGGMLQQAGRQLHPAPGSTIDLVCGEAAWMPFADAAFDLVFCVNALHHFAEPAHFVAESRRLLRPGGALAVVGMDPHRNQDIWYLYDYFPGTRETDLRRFPSGETIAGWMAAAGLSPFEQRVVERIEDTVIGREVLRDPFLQKEGTSQLALLDGVAYDAGIARIQAEIRRGEEQGKEAVFPVKIALILTIGRQMED